MSVALICCITITIPIWLNWWIAWLIHLSNQWFIYLIHVLVIYFNFTFSFFIWILIVYSTQTSFFIYLSIYLFIYLFIYIFIYLLIYSLCIWILLSNKEPEETILKEYLENNQDTSSAPAAYRRVLALLREVVHEGN